VTRTIAAHDSNDFTRAAMSSASDASSSPVDARLVASSVLMVAP